MMSFKEATFMEFEKGLIVHISELGRLLVSLFLWMRQEYWQGSENNSLEEGEKRQGIKPRNFGTIFGQVRYWRTYVYREKEGGGRYPLDIELWIPWDGFSMRLRSLATRIATKMSYAQTVAVLGMFLHWSPCQKSVEEISGQLDWGILRLTVATLHALESDTAIVPHEAKWHRAAVEGEATGGRECFPLYADAIRKGRKFRLHQKYPTLPVLLFSI